MGVSAAGALVAGVCFGARAAKTLMLVGVLAPGVLTDGVLLRDDVFPLGDFPACATGTFGPRTPRMARVFWLFAGLLTSMSGDDVREAERQKVVQTKGGHVACEARSYRRGNPSTVWTGVNKVAPTNFAPLRSNTSVTLPRGFPTAWGGVTWG